jgi:hypothetical protein
MISSQGGFGMKRDMMDVVVQWLVEECQDAGEDLDSLETAVVERLRELGQRGLQQLLEQKKGATKEPGGRVRAVNGLDLWGIGPRRCSRRSGT